jgi:hypothetical protein
VKHVEDLSAQLAAVGIAGRQRTRILAEIADHLSCDPDATLGDPAALARQFADELGTLRARRAAFAAFAALAVAGVLSAVMLATAPAGVPRVAFSQGTASLGAAIAVLSAQVAFVSGVLAGLRALRRRRSGVVARAEAVVIVRRAAVGLAAGLGTMLGIALLATGLAHHVAPWWRTLAFITAAVGAASLAAAAPATLRASRLRPVAAGPAGDLFDDLGSLVPRALRGRPWSLAVLVAGTIVVAITAAGALQADGYDGALRGVVDGGACLMGFAVLGRYIGLRN